MTPDLKAVVPADLYPGQLVTYVIDIKHVHSPDVTPESSWPYEEMRIGDTLLQWDGRVSQSTRYAPFENTMVQATVTDIPAARDIDANILFHNGFAQKSMDTMIQCNFAGDNCYSTRIHPTVTGVSQAEGYTSGAQHLEITGVGFGGKTSEVTVDGVPCEVISRTKTTIKCVTGEVSKPSVGGESQPGQHGLILTEKSVAAADFANATADSVEIATSFEYIRQSRQ